MMYNSSLRYSACIAFIDRLRRRWKHAPVFRRAVQANAPAYLRPLKGPRMMSCLRIPEKATTLSGAWRPRDPVDDDQGGARA